MKAEDAEKQFIFWKECPGLKRAILWAALGFLVCLSVFIYGRKPVVSPDIIDQGPGITVQTETVPVMPGTLEPPGLTAVSTETTEETSATMKLSDVRGLNDINTADTPADVSYSIKKDTKERTIMPGVKYKSGEGINMAVDEDEKIQIRRDNTYGSRQYQVLWKKSY